MAQWGQILYGVHFLNFFEIFWPLDIQVVTLYSYLSILIGKISTVFLQILEYLHTDQGFESLEQSWYF